MTLTLNADVGEDPVAVHDGTQASLLALVARANVACGGHAGDVDTMTASVRQCAELGVAVGAHPSYPDRAGFGRTSMVLASDTLRSSLEEQLQALAQLAARIGTPVVHVKPHGALYHDVCADPARADTFMEAVQRALTTLPIVLLAGAPTAPRFRTAGFSVVEEGFADRGYTAAGTLIPRGTPGALLAAGAAVAQARRLATEGRIQTLCVHADTPGALALARAVHAALARPS